MTWHYQFENQAKGPVSDAELDALAAAGTITPSTLVWRAGMENWLQYSEARPTAGKSAEVVATDGVLKCDKCGNYVPARNLLQISGRNICSECKPAVLQSIQQAGDLSVFDEVERLGPPWEQRETLGFFPAAWGTLKGVLLQPSATFASMKREGGYGRPLSFFLLSGSIGLILYYFYMGSTLSALNGSAMKDVPDGARQFFAANMTALIILGIIAVPCFLTIYAFVYSAITHICLKICTSTTQPYETTLRVTCYASGAAYFLMIIPIVGAISGIWGLCALCIGLGKAHQISTGKAVFAVFLPMIVCCALWIGVIILASLAGATAHH